MEDIHSPHISHKTIETTESHHSVHKSLIDGGHTRGSEHSAEKHSAHMGDSGPLVHQLKSADWQAHSSDKRSSGTQAKHVLPSLELSGHDSLKQTLSNEKLSPDERLKAAKRLVQDGIHSLHFKDLHGQDHDYQIKLFNSGKVAVTEAGHNALLPAGDTAFAEAKVAHTDARKAAPHPTETSSAAPPGRESRPSVPHLAQPHAAERAPMQQHLGGERVHGGSDRSLAWSGNPGHGRAGSDGRGGTAVRNPDGSVSISFTGCATDTDGRGASRHAEDSHRKSGTALSRSDGQYLDTDKDSYIVLSQSVAEKFGIHKGDLGRLIRKDTGQSVPVVFGDVGHEGRRTAEASLAALRRLGFSGVDGNNGISGGQFEIVMTPGSGNGRGDIARNPQLIASKLQRTNNMVVTDL